MKITEEKLLDVITGSLKEEHASILKLLSGHQYNSFDGGIFYLPETVLVFLIYKKLLKSKSFRGHSIIWENSYIQSKRLKKRHKYADLVISDIKSKQWDYIEFGMYSPDKVCGDYKKLLDYKDAEVADKYIVIFRFRTKNQKHLDDLIEQTLHKKKKRAWKKVTNSKSIRWRNFPKFDESGDNKIGEETAWFEISIFRVG